MKHLRLLLLAAFTLTAAAQTPPAGAPAKPKPYSSADTHAYIAVADGIQLHLKMSERLRGKYKEGSADMLAFAGKLSKESIALFTPGVDAAMAHGVDGKKIPQELSKNDKAALAKFGAIKDEKKWALAFFEHYAKEAKKSAAEAEKGLKTAQDAELKAYIETASAQLKSQAEAIDAKFKELKAQK